MTPQDFAIFKELFKLTIKNQAMLESLTEALAKEKAKLSGSNYERVIEDLQEQTEIKYKQIRDSIPFYKDLED